MGVDVAGRQIVRDGIVHLWISADEPLEKRQTLRRGGKDPRRPRVTEHDVIEFQPRRSSPRVRNGREAPRLQSFQASPRAGRFDRQESSTATRQLISTCPAKGYP